MEDRKFFSMMGGMTIVVVLILLAVYAFGSEVPAVRPATEAEKQFRIEAILADSQFVGMAMCGHAEKKKMLPCGVGKRGDDTIFVIFDEMDSAAKFHKAVRRDPTVMKAQDVLRLATSEAARVMQRPDLGSLAVGKTADIIIVNLDRPHLTPLYNIYSQLVYSAGGGDVDSAIINGKLVMDNREILTVDEAEIIDRANFLAREVSHG